ncbi:sulfite exporter TauE/SafE family protein [Lutimonas zeaxanthinifaciens]|uniref:sulfite exporter TauE/SafE family protein n=1 Tax=Lutimonas zeaxanthinifaciens TaxID=3060215 RepID=UPI00265CED37|nr:sulfite exporter TauE/SafE family protein [Lutimonas sp. YSD2104]WKK65618.1 sulfite exporter TauE/SafE family protein [Lutimonas sp. YSD2104]
MTFPFFAGLLASMLHVIMGPDHVAAVMPFIIESKRKAWKIGLFWGVGHIFGMLLIGSLFLFFKELIPVEEISSYSEQLVGLVLIIIGVWAFYKILKPNPDHSHLHVHTENEPFIHKHQHDHSQNPNHEHRHQRDDSKTEKQGYLASFWIGVLHGLAGIAHFILFLPVLGFKDNFDAGLYIAGFISGILVAMILFSLILAKVIDFAKNEHNQNLYKGIRVTGGIFALVVGIYWILGQ